MPVNLAVLRPAQDRHAGELGAVVANHGQRPTTPGNDGIQFTHHTVARQRGIGDQCQALPRMVIDDGQHPEAAAIGESNR